MASDKAKNIFKWNYFTLYWFIRRIFSNFRKWLIYEKKKRIQRTKSGREPSRILIDQIYKSAFCVFLLFLVLSALRCKCKWMVKYHCYSARKPRINIGTHRCCINVVKYHFEWNPNECICAHCLCIYCVLMCVRIVKINCFAILWIEVSRNIQFNPYKEILRCVNVWVQALLTHEITVNRIRM